MIPAVEGILVSHTHWDREWYRTYQAFRARLVDTLDRVLDLFAEDPGYRFLLDGQSVILEDYLEIRPGRRTDLEDAVNQRRLAIGPWYVQPDTLMPSGEAHVRNLIEGRRVGLQIGPVSRIAYTPDSFGHPAQLPEILAGFGLDAFVYWRGIGSELDELPAEYLWRGRGGPPVLVCHMYRGYGNSAHLPPSPADAVERLRPVIEELSARTRSDRILLMNGSDHLLPDSNTSEVAEALTERLGVKVRRGLLEDFVEGIGGDLPEFSGELLGARISNLLPGVWSTRTYLKLRNRRCEALLEGWAEPWSAIAALLGGPDERPSLRAAWRALLHNQAHDSICGCSQDAVHEQMLARYDISEELATETTKRSLDRIAGLGPERRVPWEVAVDLAVFNPSPHIRTDVVRIPLDAYPPYGARGDGRTLVHPLIWRNMRPGGLVVDGVPARLVPAEPGRRLRLIPDQQDWELEFVASDIPSFGYKRVRLEESEETPDEVDAGTRIAAGDVAVEVSGDGTLNVQMGDRSWRGLCDLEDVGDRGDSYDFDQVQEDFPPRLEAVSIERRRHPSGIQTLFVRRVLRVPSGLNSDRTARSTDTVTVDVTSEARVAPGVPRVDLLVRIENLARDHRLRILFPTRAPAERFLAATTFDVAGRSTGPIDDSKWIHPAPKTFPHQGWISCNGLSVVAPGLVEGEVTAEGVIAVTLLRAVGWLSRFDLLTRAGGAGPSLPVPGAQCLRTTTARLALLLEADPRAARDAELGLWGTAIGDRPLADDGISLLSVEPRTIVLSAVKPAEREDGIVVRVYNPTDSAVTARVASALGFSRAEPVRLDETPSGEPLSIEGGLVSFELPARAIGTILLR